MGPAAWTPWVPPLAKISNPNFDSQTGRLKSSRVLLIWKIRMQTIMMN